MSLKPLSIPYESFAGENVILRTIQHDEGDILVSLEDMVSILVKENSTFSSKLGKQGFSGFLKATIDVLDDDEKLYVPTSNGDRQEIFVTQPGMYRVISRDNSPACKKFQRWLFHKVLPSIQKYGTYPPPDLTNDSDIKSLAKALVQNSELILKEIEEREKLEALVAKKFGITDQRLQEISERLDRFEVQDIDELVDIEIECSAQNLECSRVLILHWCFKLCIEKNIKYRKDGRASFEHLFPLSVVKEAIRMSQDTSK